MSLTDFFSNNRIGGGRRVEPNRVAAPDAHSTRSVEESRNPNDSNTGAGKEQSDVGVKLENLQERMEKAEQRLRDKDRYITELQQEREAWRRQAESRDVNPVQTKEEEADPFDDEGTIALFQEAFEKSPAHAAREMQRYYAQKLEQKVASRLEKMQTNMATEKQQQAIVANFYNELAEAAEMSDAAKEVIREAVDSNWSEGELVYSLRRNPELAKVPGALSAHIIKLAYTKGSTKSEEPRQVMAARPKANTRTSLDEPEPTEEDEILEFKNRVVNAEGGGRLKFL